MVGMDYRVRHLARIDPLPEQFFTTFGRFNKEVYTTMWGLSEYFGTGNLADRSVTDRLVEIDIPVLLTSGRYDTSTRQCRSSCWRACPTHAGRSSRTAHT